MRASEGKHLYSHFRCILLQEVLKNTRIYRAGRELCLTVGITNGQNKQMKQIF